MANRLSIILAFSLSFMMPSVGHSKALDKMFESLGAQVNYSSPGAFQDQAAGYYTGGGFVMRQKNKTIQPINISLPKVGMGCNIDLYMGSISFIKGQELAEMGKSVLKGAPTYGLQLAMKSMAPQIENLLVELRKHVQDMNSLMMNSCNASRQLVGAIMPRNTVASEILCKDLHQGGSNDSFAAHKHCRDGNELERGTHEAKQKNKDLLIGEYNLVWHALKKMPEYKDDAELASFIMTTVGTLVSNKVLYEDNKPDRNGNNGKVVLRYIVGKADQKEFINAYLNGGDVEQLVCNDSDKCLNPVLKRINIPYESSMKAKVLKKIQRIKTQYLKREAISEEDKAFLSDAANLPVYRYIQVSAAVGADFMNDAAEYIAISLLLVQFDKIASQILEAIDSLQKIQLEDSAIQAFKRDLQRTRANIQALQVGVDNGASWRLTQMMKAYEHTIVSRNT